MTVSFIFIEDYSNTQIAGLVLVSDFFLYQTDRVFFIHGCVIFKETGKIS